MSDRYPGFLDPIDGTTIRGWAHHGEAEDGHAMVDIFIDAAFTARIVAKAYRADLEAEGVQDGFAAFAFEIPIALQDGETHDVDVRLTETSTSLRDAPRAFRIERKDSRLLREKRKWAAKTLVHEMPRAGDLRASLVTTRKIAIFGTYHDATTHLAYHRVLLEGLSEAGFTILIVHACDTHRPSVAETTIPHCFTILKRNIGYDFGSFAVGVFAVCDLLPLVDELVLMNDSVLLIEGSVASTIYRLRKLGTDVASCTDSFEHHYHLQSYLLWFGGRVCRSSVLPRFMAGFSFTSVKDQVISEGEIGLSRALGSEGFSLGALHPYQALAMAWTRGYRETARRIADLPGLPIEWDGAPSFKRALLERLDLIVSIVLAGKPLNPSHFFWDTLIEDFGFPFVKRELVVANPCNVPTYHKIGSYFPPGSEALRAIMEVRHRFGGVLVPPSFAVEDSGGARSAEAVTARPRAA